MRVLVTCPPMIGQLKSLAPIYPEIEFVTPIFQQTMSEEKLVQHLPGCDAWIIGDDPATRTVFESGRASLKCVVKWGVGVDNVDQQALKDMGIPFTNTPGLFGESVSDIALGMLLMLTRQLHVIHSGVVAGGWPKPCGMDLASKHVCLVGLGSIGQAVARKLQAFGCQVRASDPAFCGQHPAVHRRSGQQVPNVAAYSSLQEAANGAQVLIVTCDLNPSTLGLIDASVFALLDPGALIINVSRGPIIKEEDLVQALDNHHIQGAGLDVYTSEPLPADNPLRRFVSSGRVVFGSHNGSNTTNGVLAASKAAIEFVLNYQNAK